MGVIWRAGPAGACGAAGPATRGAGVDIVNYVFSSARVTVSLETETGSGGHAAGDVVA